MSNGAETTYFVRHRGKVSGPFTVPRLKQLLGRGQFSRFHEVSVDMTNWQPASELSELFVAKSSREIAPAVPEAAPVPNIPKQPPRRAPVSEGVSDANWPNEASPYDISPNRLRGIKIAAGVAALFVLVIAAAVPLLLDNFDSSSRTDGASASSASSGTSERTKPASFQFGGSAGPIRSIDDDHLEGAVGKVVCGLRFELPDGVVKEFASGSGTGFLISADGDVLTNQHVVKQEFTDSELSALENALRMELKIDVSISQRIWVILDESYYLAETVYSDADKDIGILRTSCTGRPFLALSGTDDVAKGTPLRAYGFPGAADVSTSAQEEFELRVKEAALKTPGLTVKISDQFGGDQLESTLTAGIVSRVVNKGGRMLIQHNAAISPGNSGGPLLSENDAIVRGVNTLLIKDAQGIFFAVTPAQLRDKIDEHVPGAVWK